MAGSSSACTAASARVYSEQYMIALGNEKQLLLETLKLMPGCTRWRIFFPFLLCVCFCLGVAAAASDGAQPGLVPLSVLRLCGSILGVCPEMV